MLIARDKKVPTPQEVVLNRGIDYVFLHATWSIVLDNMVPKPQVVSPNPGRETTFLTFYVAQWERQKSLYVL